MPRWRTFFVWALPLLWAVCSAGQSKFPGDENAFYVASSLPAAWIAPFVFLGRASKEMIPVYVVLAGVPVMVGIGWVMDRLKVRKSLWAILYLAGGATVLLLALSSFPSMGQAIGKNGSLWAYVLLASNLGLYGSVVLSVVPSCIVRGVRYLVAD